MARCTSASTGPSVADRPLLRYLTPVLRPVFRANHNYAIKQAMQGLEPYARRRG
jgi:hypothetical protein